MGRERRSPEISIALHGLFVDPEEEPPAVNDGEEGIPQVDPDPPEHGPGRDLPRTLELLQDEVSKAGFAGASLHAFSFVFNPIWGFEDTMAPVPR